MTRLLRTCLMLAVAMAVAQPALAFERSGARKILVVAQAAEIPVLDPHARYDAATRMMQNALYDALARYAGNPAVVQPWLAESWSSNEAMTEWTFRLAGNARFHDGSPVDAAAVKFSYERGLKLNKGVAWMLKDILEPSGIEAVDARTVRFRLRQPYPAFISFVPMWYVVNPKEVLANEVAGDLGEKWLTDHAAGSGPFRIKRWDGRSVMEIEAVADYWKGWPMAEKDRLAGVVYRIIRETAQRKIALQRGEVDITADLTPEDYDQMRSVPGLVVEEHTGFRTFTVKMNNKKGPTADLNFRKALAYAFDYEAMVQIQNGAAAVMTGPFPAGLRFQHDVPDRPVRNLDKAREYLAKTQWPNGGLTIEYVYMQGQEPNRRLGLAMLNALKPLNINVNMVPLPWATMVARGAAPETAPDTVSVFVGTVANDPDAVAMQYHPSARGNYWGMHQYDNPEVARLIESARTEPDPARRAALYASIQQKLVDDQPDIFGTVGHQLWIRRDYVKGFAFTPTLIGAEIDLFPLWIDAK